MRRYKDWLKQGKADLASARDSLIAGHYEWAWFQYQQAAEKAAKAHLEFRGIAERGHSITNLLRTAGVAEEALIEKAQVLDRYDIPTRYPNSFDAGSPVDYFEKKSAREAIEYAEGIIRFVEEQMR